MSRGLSWALAGILAGFGALFLTIWSGEDSGSMAAVMFACASVMLATSEVRKPSKAPCPDERPDQPPAD
ncbi:MAG: hypothetical protein FD125_1660 [bacterium]|nr:MAG: hypothetical protein FD125_1660 [bacterium]